MKILDEFNRKDSTISTKDKNWASALHFVHFSNIILPFLGIVISLIVFLTKKDKSPYIRKHAAKVFNFQIVFFLLLWLTIYIGIFIQIHDFYILLSILPIIIISSVSAIKAGIAAQQNKLHEYLVYIPILK